MEQMIRVVKVVDRLVPVCSVEGCSLPSHVRGWCRNHYQRWQRWGDPLGEPPSGRFHTRTEAERFWEFVDQTGDCWIWTGGQAGGQPHGRYGSFRRSQPDGRQVYAHRMAWELENGPIPSGMTIDHLCGTTLCQRVEHMNLVTRAENARRAAARRSASHG